MIIVIFSDTSRATHDIELFSANIHERSLLGLMVLKHQTAMPTVRDPGINDSGVRGITGVIEDWPRRSIFNFPTRNWSCLPRCKPRLSSLRPWCVFN